MNKKQLVLIWVVILLLITLSAKADTLFLKNGMSVEGNIVGEADDYYIVEMYGGTVEFTKDEVQSVSRGEISEEEVKKNDESLNYRIVDEKDISMKALIKPLSSYTTAELVNLPVNIRKKYSILVAPNLPKEKYIDTFDSIILDSTHKNNDIDEISLWVYDNADELNSAWSVAQVLWCPSEGWDKVTPEIASSNDRSGYETIINWSDEYKMKFESTLEIIQEDEKKQIKYSSESSNYKYSIIYPAVVNLGEINKITITILNTSNKNDNSLTIINIDATKGDKIIDYLLEEDKSAFRILRVEPNPKKTEPIFSTTYFDYEGLKSGESKRILLYFKLTKVGDYEGEITFYTDRHGNEEYELIAVLRIKCEEEEKKLKKTDVSKIKSIPDEKAISYIKTTKYAYQNVEATYFELSTCYSLHYENPKFIGWETEPDTSNPTAKLVTLKFSVTGIHPYVLELPEGEVPYSLRQKMSEAVPILKITWKVDDSNILKIEPYNWYAKDAVTVYKETAITVRELKKMLLD